LDEVKPSESYVKNQPRLRNDNILSSLCRPKFSVRRTKEIYRCTICEKLYLERRSLRKQSTRVHGVVVSLPRRKRIALNKKNVNEANQVCSAISKENKNSEKVYDNKDSCEKTKLTSIESTTSSSTISTPFVMCCCQKNVNITSLKQHLINHHDIRASNVLENVESLLLNETKTSSGDKKIDLKKSNNKRYSFNQNPPTIAQKQSSKIRYECDICLGMYSTIHNLNKHRRKHSERGETKENFHNFECRYVNSPFNKKNKLLQSSMKSANTTAKNVSNEINENDTLQLNNSKRNKLFNQNSSISSQATPCSERMDKNNENNCICGRSFRNPRTLFIHKKNCEFCQIEDNTRSTRISSDKDSDTDIIIIEERCDNEVEVGKDVEDKSGKSESHLKEDTSSPHTSSYKDFTSVNNLQELQSIVSDVAKIIDVFEMRKRSF